MDGLSHLTTLTLTQEQVNNEFLRISYTQLPDPHWHFETVVHKSSRLGPPGKVPAPGGALERLAIFNRTDPPCDIEMFGAHVTYDINPADWLDLWLEQQRHVTILSRKRFPDIGGEIGDVLAKWNVEKAPWVGRFFVTKVGPRVFLLWARVAEKDYAQAAEPIFLSIMSLRVFDTSAGPLAEGVRWANGETPVPWKLALPTSWQAEGEPGNDLASAFQATLLAPAPPGAAPQILGKLSFAILSPTVVPNAQDLAAKSMEAVRSSGVTADSDAFAPEPASEPCTESWYLSTPGKLNGTPIAVHGRILRHPSAWVSAVVVSPAREISPPAWMRARRLLDIVTMTLVIG
jgi:hypothetical protein